MNAYSFWIPLEQFGMATLPSGRFLFCTVWTELDRWSAVWAPANDVKNMDKDSWKKHTYDQNDSQDSRKPFFRTVEKWGPGLNNMGQDARICEI